MEAQTKVCRRCGETKELAAFRCRTDRKNVPGSYCRNCADSAAAAAAEKYPDRDRFRRRRRNLMTKYGLTPLAYQEMLDRQNGVCAICHRPERNGNPLSVDHCHTTNAVRALLCHKCNSMLGMAEDVPDRLRMAALYLEQHESTH